MAQYKRRSRLVRKEKAKSLRRAYSYFALTIALILVVIFLGLPLLVKIAAFLGEIRGSSLPVESQDTLAPPTPKVYSPAKATNQREVTLEGSSEAEVKITFFLNGRNVKEIITEKSGAFTAKISLTGERNEISLIAEDKDGNKSQESEKFIIILDEKPPELEIFSPVGEKVSWEEKQIEISGQTEKEASLYVNTHFLILDQEGNFTQTISLSEGENIIKITAKDEAGNETEKEIIVNYAPF